MPLSSLDIAQMNGSYQSLSLSQQSYAQGITQSVYGGGGAMSGMGSDAVVGGAMNRMSAVGAPLAAGAMGLMGLDPLSMGMRAGWGAMSAGAGLGGGALAAAGAALPMMAVGAGVSYAGGQMMSGAQQQMGLNNTLRQNFAFRNAFGGQGFQRAEMSSIGNLVREMSESQGPGGEMASFRELSGLAGRMGSMGLAQGVKDVQEFSRRFKEMLTTLKSMAKDLGTTLEGAMEFAGAARGSGIFGMQRTAGFTSAVRGAAVAGGLAVSEVTAAASIGSQIARSIGGLGRQGAMAGVRTIGQIGVAQQMGTLTEEDIYNVTGLSGAEGRQAFAQSSLQSSANFLRGGRGRRLLASLAEKDGQLNEDNVQQLLSGGMSIGETMRLDRQQLGKVGRANFIRNEGRLRGAALERLGGFLPALQLQEWAQSKGVDINDMDDRSMLFAQRQLHMGRDEVDAAMKMVNNLPQILAQSDRSGRRDSFFQGVGQARKTQGLEGIKQRLDHAREHVNSRLQKVGQDFFNQASEEVDAFFNRLTSTYVQTYGQDIDQQFRSMTLGGRAGGQAGQRAFGVGGSGMGAAARQARGAGGGLGGRVPGQDLAQVMNQGGEGFLGELLRGRSGASRLAEAGFNIEGLTGTQIQNKFRDIEQVRRAAATTFDRQLVSAGAKNAEWIKDAYAMRRVFGQGDVRMQSFGALLQRQSPELAARWENATQAEKAVMMANLERGAGVTGAGALASNYGLPEEVQNLAGLGTGGFATGGQESQAYARALFGDRRSQGQKTAGSVLGGVGAATALTALGPVGLALGAFGAGSGRQGEAGSLFGRMAGFAEGLFHRGMGTTDFEERAGAYLKSDQARNAIYGLLNQDASIARAASDTLSGELASMSDEEKQSPIGQTKQRFLAASKYYRLMTENPKATSEEQEALARRYGMSVKDLQQGLGAMGSILETQQRRDMAESARRERADAGVRATNLAAAGVYDAATGGLTAETASRVGKLGADASRYASLAAANLQDLQGLGGTEASVDSDRALYGNVRDRSDTMSQLRAGMSVRQKREAASALGGLDGRELAYSASVQSKLEAGMRRRGAGSTLASMLGVGLSKDDLKKLTFGTANEAAHSALTLAEGAGIKDAALIDEIKHAGLAAKGGRSGEATEALRRVMESPEFQRAQKDKRMQNQEQQDPLQAAIKTNGEKANQLLKEIAVKMGVNNELISKIDVKDPEKK